MLFRSQQLNTWAKDVESYVLERAVTKNIVPKGYKLGTTSAHRKIVDITKAAEVLTKNGLKDIWEAPKLKSVANLEKMAQKGQVVNWLGDLVVKPVGEPKLVRDRITADDFK